MSVSRIDFGEMAKPEKTINGFLRAPCYATRAGIFLYRNDDGSVRRELRPPEEVFDAESLATLAGVPVTNEHPPMMLDPSNTKEFARGFTSETVEQEDQFVKTGVTIMDADLISLVETRDKTETSCGYNCNVEETPGEWNGQRYDAIQRRIRYNHLAVVSKGRAGPAVRIRMDGGGAVQVFDHSEGDFCMTKIRIDGVEFEVSEPAAMAVTQKIKKDEDGVAALQAQMQAIQAELEKLKGAYAAKEMEMDACKKEMDTMKSAAESNKMDSAKIHEAAMARLALVQAASKHVDSEKVKFDSMSDKEIKVEVIKARKPDFNPEGRTDAFIDGLFEGITAGVEDRTDSLGNAVNAAKPTGSAPTDARVRSMAADRDAWKTAK